jgi:SAM-dependent methyltransferase
VNGAPTLQHRVLEGLEGARNYNAWVASLVRPYLGDDPIEIGSGTGTYAELWLADGLGRLTVSDTDPAMVERLRSRFAEDARVAVQELDLLDAPEARHSAIVALNVLEHIEDDVLAVTAAQRLVRPGGAVVVFVPAFPFAMSRFDRAIGHYRRYTAGHLRSVFVEAGLEVEDVTYVNAPGLLAWTVGMRLLRMTPREGVVLRCWDRAVIPATRRLEARRRPPFGQSVLGVARTRRIGR